MFPIFPAIALRVVFAGMVFAASAASAGLMLLSRKSDPPEDSKLPTGDRPLHNVASREETFAKMRDMIREKPDLASSLSDRHKKLLGLDEKDP